MIVIIDGRVAAQLTRSQWRSLEGCKPFRQASGRVLSPAAATDILTRRFLVMAAAACVAIWAILIVLTLVGNEYDRAQCATIFLVLAAATPAALALAYLIKLDSWRKSLSGRYVLAPPPGTLISVDERGATIGERSAPWSEVRLERAEFQTLPDDGDGRLVVWRLRLNGCLGDRLIDASLVDNGQAIVNAVFCRLAPESPRPRGRLG